MQPDLWPSVYENLYEAARFTRMADQVIDARLSRKGPLTPAERKEISDNLEFAARHRNAALDALTT